MPRGGTSAGAMTAASSAAGRARSAPLRRRASKRTWAFLRLGPSISAPSPSTAPAATPSTRRRRRAAAPGPAGRTARCGGRRARRPTRAARPPAATAGTSNAPRRPARGIALSDRARPRPSTTTAGARLASTAGRRGCLSRGGMSACAIPASTSAGSCARSAATLAGGVSTDSVRGEPLRFWDARAISSSLMGSCAFLERIKQW